MRNNTTTLLLMNHNYIVAKIGFVFGNSMHFISQIEIFDSARLPFSVRYAPESKKRNEFEQWICHRIMPCSRDFVNPLLNVIGHDTLQNSLCSFGLNLTDGYWFKSTSDTSTWEDVNFNRNPFPYDIGNFAFGIEMDHPDLYSPDLTTNGIVQKAWRIKEGTRILVKGGRKPNYEEPLNEVAATKIMEEICLVPFVKYSLLSINGHYYSACENFVPDNLILVPANDIYRTAEKSDFMTVDTHIRERCDFFQIPGYKEFFDNLYYVNYIINNTDCHLGNYGFLYDIDTLRFVGPAPIYDPGTSMWGQDRQMPCEEEYALAEQELKLATAGIRKPFKLKRIDTKQIREIIEDVYTKSNQPSARIALITKNITQRAELFNQYIDLEQQRHNQKKEKHLQKNSFYQMLP